MNRNELAGLTELAIRDVLDSVDGPQVAAAWLEVVHDEIAPELAQSVGPQRVDECLRPLTGTLELLAAGDRAGAQRYVDSL